MSKRTKAQEAEMEQAREALRKLLPPGTRIYGDVMHVSSSGMSRIIQLRIAMVDEHGAPEIMNITGLAARALGERCTDRPAWGIRVPGCGMDMVYHVAMNLSYALHGFGSENDSPAQIKARKKISKGADKRYGARDWGKGGYTLDIQR